MGDFVAHRDERNKGVITRSVQQWFEITRFFGYRLQLQGGLSAPLQSDRMPPNTTGFLRATLQRTPHKKIKEDTRLSRSKARAVLIELSAKFRTNNDKTVCIAGTLSQSEVTLLQYLCSYMIVEPAFDADKLIADLVAVLRSSGVLGKKEEPAFRELSQGISLYAASVMHRSKIHLSDGTECPLSIRMDEHPPALGVHVAVPCVNIGQSNEVSMAQTIYSVPGKLAQLFAPELLNQPGGLDDYEIEVDTTQRLVAV